jgi:hypothetical protein
VLDDVVVYRELSDSEGAEDMEGRSIADAGKEAVRLFLP